MTKNSNVNKNNNIIYLDLGDFDLKPKTKKKPKKKKTDNKKKAVDNLKEVLSEFDNLLNQAQEKKIKIPEELGSLPSNIEDINTIKELKQLDDKGTFHSDDEIGFFFKEVDKIQEALNEFTLK